MTKDKGKRENMDKYIKNKYVIGSLALVVVCLVLLICAGGSGQGNSPKGVVKKLEHAINSENETKILKCYDSDLKESYQFAKKLAPETSLIEELGLKGFKVKYLIESVEENPDGTVTVSCFQIATTKKSKTESIAKRTFTTEKINGTWIVRY